MVRVRRHAFQPSDATDWRGQPAECMACPLPADNEIHQVEQQTDEQAAIDRRILGERE